jgi:hypothetical protein
MSEKSDLALAKIVERFQKGDISPITHAAMFRLPDNHPAAKWSFGNQVLGYAQADTLDIRGFEAWKDVGRKVKKGSSACYIYKPIMVKDAKDGDEDGMKLIGFSPIPVFAAGSTESFDPDQPDQGLVKVQIHQMPSMAHVAQKLGLEVQYTICSPDRGGDFSARENKINLGSADVGTFYHELAHAVHSKLEQEKGSSLKQLSKEEVETVAEASAMVLAQLYDNHDRSGFSWRYIQNLSADPLRTLQKFIGTIKRVIDYIERLA